MTADVQQIARGESMRALTLVIEVILGAWLVFLFMLALAWDPIDRRVGARGRRLAERQALRPTGEQAEAYAILPAE